MGLGIRGYHDRAQHIGKASLSEIEVAAMFLIFRVNTVHYVNV